MSRDFDGDLERALERCARQSQATHDHDCGLCTGKQCVLCGDKCLTFEAPALMCSGPCAQRVRRDQHYHVTRDGSRLWCHKCYLGLKSVIPPPTDHGEPATALGLWYKRDLIKRKFDEDVADRAGKGCENPNFKGSYLGRFPLVLADFLTSDHLSERSRP